MAKKERAAGRGHTWDPWPCCSADVDESRWYRGRPKRESVCFDCRELIRLGEDARRRSSEAGETTFRWTGEYHQWPGYYGAYHFRHRPAARPEEPYDAGDALRRRMFELVNAIARPAPGRPWNSSAPFVLTCSDRSRRVSPYRDETLVTADPKVRAALDALDGAVREALESAYQEGKERGQNILLNLAGNEITVNDFNRRTADGAE